MNRAEEAQAAVGKSVYRKRSGPSCTYVIEKAIGEDVYLRCTHKGGRSTYKWIAHLWLDYAECK